MVNKLFIVLYDNIAQVVELVWKIRRETEKRQVDGAVTGITSNFGGFGNNIISILVESI